MTQAVEQQPIYTALNIPAATCHPSISSVQWTDDGQLCLTTRTAVYLLTPNPGINFDNDPSSVITALVDKTGEKPSLGWFRTMIEFSKVSNTVWADRCADWPALSIASLDVAMHQVACSPSNTTKAGGCIIATLSTNMDVTLWMSNRNHLKGEWVEVLAVPPLLDKIFDDGAKSTASVQISSICWSRNADFNIYPSPMLGTSVLILGNRAGDLVLFRFDSSVNALHHLTTLSVEKSGAWITHVSASSWSLVTNGCAQCDVAYATSSGCIGYVTISQHLQPSATFLTERFKLEFEFSLHQTVSQPDGSAVTALRWVHGDGPKVLFYSKPGRFILSLPNAATEAQQFTLFPKSPKLSAGSTSLSQVSGVYYWEQQSALVVSLFDGSIHFVHNIFSQPRLGDSINASRQVRTIFYRAENSAVTRADLCSMAGMTTYDGGENVIWVHESIQPNDFSYKHDAKHNIMLIVSRLWNEDTQKHTLERLNQMLMNYRACTGTSPLQLLRPFYFHIQRMPSEYYTGVMEILRHPSPCEAAPFISPLPDEHPVQDDKTKGAFRDALYRNLYGRDRLQVSRMKLGIADFLWKVTTDSKQQEECGIVAHGILVSISVQFLEIMLHHLEAVAPLIQPTDMPFVDRIILQSVLPNTPPELSDHAKSVWKLIHKTEGSGEALNIANDSMGERCPACQGNVPLENITSATCVNGHQWVRCSVTSFLLATPLVRTCIGCSRKTFVPPSSRDQNEGRTWLPEVARGWVVEQLLEAVNRCLFCGNAFVQLS